MSFVRDMLTSYLILSHVGFESRLREVCEELLGPPHRYRVSLQLFFLPCALLLPYESNFIGTCNVFYVKNENSS